MSRQNFFERMEREIDFQKEYEKIEDIVCNEDRLYNISIDNQISTHFRKIKWRGNYTSIYEL